MQDPIQQADREMQAVAAEAAANAKAWGEANEARGGVCDFCCNELSETPTVTTWLSAPMIESLAVLDTETKGTATIGHVLDEFWAACAACDPIIEQRDPAKLAAHVRATRGPAAPTCPPGQEAYEQAELTALYAHFFESARKETDDSGEFGT